MRRSAVLVSAASLCASAAVLQGLRADEEPQHVLLQNPQQAPSPAAATNKRQLHGRFLHITDFHPDAYYKTHSSTDEDSACHHGDGPAGYYGAETSDCDSPFSLVNATFDWLDENLKDRIDFIVWTGDSARHDSDEDVPRSSRQVLGTNLWIAQKFRDLLVNNETGALSVPVIPTLGNNDILPHNIMLPGPNSWLQNYATIWQNFIPEEQRHSFQLGGWFYVEVIPNKLAVVSLNTLYFFDRNAAIDNCIDTHEPGFKQLEWLRIQLQFMRNRGMKAILMGHVPPARTDSKMLWDESCWQKYTLWLQQYRDVVTASIYGHMNIDHFMLQDTNDISIQKFAADYVNQEVRESMDDELTAQGANDYLAELRQRWSKLPKPPGRPATAPTAAKLSAGKKKKGKDMLGGPWAERYQLSIVGPSIVPNYFPTLRVVEYNITGLENSKVWEGPDLRDRAILSLPDVDEWESDLREAALIEVEKRKKNKKKKGSKGDKNKPHDPNLVVPEPPSRSAPPGPAYSPQPLTLMGYTQYFANLTHINNDVRSEDVDTNGRWRQGKHRGKQPDKTTDPREFKFEVEYSTFEDKVLKLQDLTVPSYVQLAYRMGKQQAKKGKSSVAADGLEVAPEDDEMDDDVFEIEYDEEDGEGSELILEQDDNWIEQHGNETVTDQKKNKKKKKQRQHNKVWLQFLKHAFVSTAEEKDLKKLDR